MWYYQQIKITYRNFEDFDKKCFNEGLKSIDWSLGTENNDLGFRTFFHLFNKTLDKHAPLKHGIRKDKKIEQKLWVTKGIQISKKWRDKLYKEVIKEKDSQKKIQKHETYRKHWNKIVDLLKVSKQTHYKYFEDNRKNCKALWDGIHQIIYSKKEKDNISSSSLLVNRQTVAGKLNIAENFNNFFTSIGKKLQNNIYPTNRDYSYYLRRPTPNIFFTPPTSPQEVINIIQDVKTSKSAGPNSLPQKIIKQIEKTISLPL